MVSRTKPLVKLTTITAPLAPFSHTDLGRHLDQPKIGNRMFFGGNLLRQPVFVQLRNEAETKRKRVRLYIYACTLVLRFFNKSNGA